MYINICWRWVIVCIMYMSITPIHNIFTWITTRIKNHTHVKYKQYLFSFMWYVYGNKALCKLYVIHKILNCICCLLHIIYVHFICMWGIYICGELKLIFKLYCLIQYIYYLIQLLFNTFLISLNLILSLWYLNLAIISILYFTFLLNIIS